MKSTKILLPVLLCILSVMMSSCFAYSSFDDMVSQPGEGTTAYEYKTTSYAATTAIADPVPETTDIVVVMPEAQSTLTDITEPQMTAPQMTEPQVTVPQETVPQETVPVFTLPEGAEPIEPDTTAEADTEESEEDAPEEGTEEKNEETFPVYSEKQIAELYEQALNKTRSYRDALTVTKTESFTANVKEANPGGALTELLANNIVKLVGSEGQQTLNFVDGKAVDNEGETVPVLLPKNDVYSLPEEGIASATIKKSGDKTMVRITLVPETVRMGEVPAFNSKAIGYLDTSSMDFKVVTINRVDITYTGSVIDAVIRSDGYIESVTYTVNMSTYAELSGMGVSGYGTLEGQQIEKWDINW